MQRAAVNTEPAVTKSDLIAELAVAPGNAAAMNPKRGWEDESGSVIGAATSSPRRQTARAALPGPSLLRQLDLAS